MPGTNIPDPLRNRVPFPLESRYLNSYFIVFLIHLILPAAGPDLWERLHGTRAGIPMASAEIASTHMPRNPCTNALDSIEIPRKNGSATGAPFNSDGLSGPNSCDYCIWLSNRSVWIPITGVLFLFLFFYLSECPCYAEKEDLESQMIWLVCR